MGWTFGWNRQADMICHLNREDTQPDRVYRTLKHQKTRENNASILWQMNEIEAREDLSHDGLKAGERKRFIQCVVMLKERGEWGCKAMSEAEGPYLYSCPVSWLDEVPCPNEWGKGWREKVRAYKGNRIEAR